jgi:hypothetical protein
MSSCTIQATGSWQQCGVSLNAGDCVDISASGMWTMHVGGSWYGPMGDWTGGHWNDNNDAPLPYQNHNEGTLLIATDLGDSVPALQGTFDATSTTTSIQFTTSSAGQLAGEINDDFLTDNAGSMTLDIAVSPRQ